MNFYIRYRHYEVVNLIATEIYSDAIVVPSLPKNMTLPID